MKINSGQFQQQENHFGSTISPMLAKYYLCCTSPLDWKVFVFAVFVFTNDLYVLLYENAFVFKYDWCIIVWKCLCIHLFVFCRQPSFWCLLNMKLLLKHCWDKTLEFFNFIICYLICMEVPPNLPGRTEEVILAATPKWCNCVVSS